MPCDIYPDFPNDNLDFGSQCVPMEIRRIHSRAHDGSSQLEATANLVWFHCGSDFTSCKISLKSAIISTVVLPRSLTLGGAIRAVQGFEATL